MRRDKSGPSGTEREPGLFPREVYSKVLDRVFSVVLSESDKLDRQRSRAPDLIAELEALSPSQRKLLIRNSSQYQAWPLIEEALVRGRSYWAEDPARAEDLARLALEISDVISNSGYKAKLVHDIKAEIWTDIGNCLRVSSDLQAAHKAFNKAEQHLLLGTGDLFERARFLDLRSSLFRAQRDFEAAAGTLAEAIRLYSCLPDRHAEGRALLNQARLIGDGGDPEAAISALKRAGGLIDEQREPRLGFIRKWNLVVFLREAGRLDEAQSLLPEVRELSRIHGGRHDRLRLLWVEGVLRSRLGQVKIAEEALNQVREGFIAAGIGYDVALVSLDLAALYLGAGQTEEVRRLAVETMPLFASRNVRRELLVAWKLFKEAAERDVATLRLVKDIAAQIRSGEDVT